MSNIFLGSGGLISGFKTAKADGGGAAEELLEIFVTGPVLTDDQVIQGNQVKSADEFWGGFIT